MAYIVVKMPHCPMCKKILEKLRKRGERVTELDMTDLMAQLGIQNQSFPVVFKEWEGYIDPDTV